MDSSYDQAKNKLGVLANKWVAESGKCPTRYGEALRSVMHIIYRWENDGDLPTREYGLETSASSFIWLYTQLGQFNMPKGLKDDIRGLYESYEAENKAVFLRLLNWVMGLDAEQIDTLTGDFLDSREELDDHPDLLKWIEIEAEQEELYGDYEDEESDEEESDEESDE